MKRIYFVGAGGIGMANLVRYSLSKGYEVSGYDRTSTPLTDALRREGAEIVFDDNPSLIPLPYLDPAETLVVYTPAVGDRNRILNRFRELGHTVEKRARLLGELTRDGRSICVAGSHGKTTTSSMTANILRQTEAGCNAFLGGILRNVNSNLILSPASDISVVEADEYDRSFHQLRPWTAVVTSTDPDHLDIYGDEEGYLEGFAHFTSLIKPGGTLILHTGLKLKPRLADGVTLQTYCGSAGPGEAGKADWYPDDIRWSPGKLRFDIVGPDVRIPGIEPAVPVEINIDNAVAAAAAAYQAGATPDEIRKGLDSFLGAERRFQIWMPGDPEDPKAPVLIDDYGHSPAEVKASIRSVRKLYPDRHITVIFQPHLYTRTRDFAPEFAEALSGADRVVLTEIYPAREAPIPGVDSQMVLKDVKSEEKSFCRRKDLLDLIKNTNFEVLITLGAADLNVLLPDIERILKEKQHSGK